MKLIQRIRDSRAGRLVFTYLLLNICFEIVQPTVSLALTSGPSQPEVQSFEPVGTTDMVDVFTGDFNYNIPLMNIPGPNGGYPINLAYHAGVSMDDEASWVGLGWNINNGALVRNVRGLPDDFDSEIDARGDFKSGDFIERKVDQKQSVTFGMGVGSTELEVFGLQALPTNLQFNARINNYRGLGYSIDYSHSFGDNSNYHLGLSLDSDDGLGVNVNYSLIKETETDWSAHNLSIGFNGNSGLSASLSKTKTLRKELDGKPGFPKITGRNVSLKVSSPSRSSALTYSNAVFSPSIGNKVNSYSLGFRFLSGNAVMGFFDANPLSVFFSTEDYNDELKEGKRYPVVGYDKNGTHSSEEYYTKDFVRQNDGMITRQTPVLGHSYYANDAYNFTGQGIAGYFRSRRSDVGRIHDPKQRNDIYGFNGSLEFASNVTEIEIIPSEGGIPQTFAIEGRKIGIGLDFTFGWNSQHAWNTHNDEQHGFEDPRTIGKKENQYYQVHGQPTILASNEMSHIGGENMYRPKLKHVGMERGIDGTGSPLSDERVNTERVVRNTLVHNFSNREYSKLPEFNSQKYYEMENLSEAGSSKVILSDDDVTTFDRINRAMDGSTTVNISNHTAGYKVLNEDGSYYVYGLPAYNKKEVNNLFSVEQSLEASEALPVGFSNSSGEVVYKHDDTDKFIHKTTQSPYAHSYMLTAIYGADYVDITQNGPTNDDLGYWVKFDYVKYADSYKWRAPYYGASLNKGAHHTTEDDKASYTYGEKEVWYLGRIETKTHVAVYHLSERKDNAESTGEFSTTANPSAATYTGLKVDKIGLYVKNDLDANGISGAKPLQEVVFSYDYSLCPNVINNTGETEYEIVNGEPTSTDLNEAHGKLTLKALWFTAQGSKKGQFNKYKFDYNSGDVADNAFLQNPEYDFNRIDGWGNYKPGGGANSPNRYFPYQDQFNQWPAQGVEAYQNDKDIFEDASAKEDFKRYQDQFASAWCLKKIHLPSGGTIQVDYETDDYGYVQDQEATQMFKITDVNDDADGLDKLYDEGVNDFEDPNSRKIYFKLEYPIDDLTGDPAEAAELIYNQYVSNIIKDENGDRNLFFKSFIQLKDIPGMAFNEECESVSGYLPLERDLTGTFGGNDRYHYGVSSTLVSGKHTHGFVTVQQTPKKSGGKFNYHPMSLLAWQFMQTNTPKLMHDVASYDDGANGNFVQQLSNLLNIVPAFASSVGATRAYAEAREFAKKIDLDRSVIRLCSPDKVKFGGGHRVRKITITDEWGTITDGETSKTYGTEYDYTMLDEDGQTLISSGVAQYEPSSSGDENALKYPLHFQGKNTFVSNNNLFAEHPFNEDLFPGASVGYRRVTIKSVNTGKQLRNESINNGRTGGVTVYNFYTAKEFPTIVDYTSFNGDGINDYGNDYKGVMNLAIPIPFIGSYSRKYYHASQAFKIELNDMHGKPKSVESYEIKTNSDATEYELVGNPITSTTYEYQTKNYIHNGNNVLRLHNKVRVVSKDDPTVLASGERDMGVEYDLFTDQRQTKSHIVNAGLEINIDIPNTESPTIFVPTFWPSFSTNKTLTRTYVTNKVIFKTGILKRTVTRDLQASSSSEIVAYDELSGQPLITKGTNEFGDELYSYNLPAYWNYDRMGHAYKNINYTFAAKMTIAPGAADSKHSLGLLVEPTGDMLDMLVRGDEILLKLGDATLKVYYADLTFDSSNDPQMLFYAYDTEISDFYSGNEYENFLYNYEFPEAERPLGKVIRSGRRNHYNAIGSSYLTKGNPFDLWESNQEFDGVSVPVLESVLSATATVYRDDWDHSLTVYQTDEELVSNPFLSGNSGIWRPYKSYTYVGGRSKSADLATGADNDGPNLRTDGEMYSVPLFSHELGDFENYVPQWEWTSEITRYNNDSYEVENVDRLGIKSSALFGLGENLSIAVGGNADYHETGVMDFENTAPTALNPTPTIADVFALTNLTFYTSPTGVRDKYISESFKIKQFYRESGGGYTVCLDLLLADYNKFKDFTNDRIGLSLISRKSGSFNANIGHYLNGVIDDGASVGSYTDVDGVSKVKLTLTAAGLENGGETLDFMKVGEKYYGRATFVIDRPGATHGSVTGVNFTNAKAHTGKMSMNLQNSVSFHQKDLRLKTGSANKYVLSLWVSRNNTDVYRYTTTGSDILTLSQVHPSTGAVTAVVSPTYKCSKMIEGWQKIDITFTMDVDYAVLRMNFIPGDHVIYVDDIRVSPRTGGMTTNVYDPSNFRLRASLNVDNYATLYYYDEQGNLVLRKQETEDGIVTLSEARGNVRKGQ